MQLIEAVPLALAQATVSDVNRLGASPGRILVLSGLFLSLRISLKAQRSSQLMYYKNLSLRHIFWMPNYCHYTKRFVQEI